MNIVNHEEHEERRGRHHNSAWKTELDGFRRKAARRVKATDCRAKLSFADNQIGLPPKRTIKKTCSVLHKTL